MKYVILITVLATNLAIWRFLLPDLSKKIIALSKTLSIIAISFVAYLLPVIILMLLIPEWYIYDNSLNEWTQRPMDEIIHIFSIVTATSTFQNMFKNEKNGISSVY